MRTFVLTVVLAVVAFTFGCGDSGKSPDGKPAPVPPTLDKTPAGTDGTKDKDKPVATPAVSAADLESAMAAAVKSANLVKFEFTLGDKKGPVATIMAPPGVTASESLGDITITDKKAFSIRIKPSDYYYRNDRASAKEENAEYAAEAAHFAIRKLRGLGGGTNHFLLARVPFGPADCTIETPISISDNYSLNDALVMLHCARTLAPKAPFSDNPLTALRQLGWNINDDDGKISYVSSGGAKSNRTIPLVAKLADVQSLSLSLCVDDEGLAPISAMTTLTSLDVTSNLTSGCFKHLKPLTKLKRLKVDLTSAADADFANLAGMTEMDSLSFSNFVGPKRGQIGAAGAAQLSNMKKAESFDLGANLSDAGLASLDLPALTTLEIVGSPVTLKTLAQAKLPALTSLVIAGTNLSDLSGLSTLPALKSINAFKTPVKDDQLAHIASSTTLEDVKIGGENLTDKGALLLSQSKTIKRLAFTDSKLTAAGVAHLCKILSLTELMIADSTGVDDAVFEHLRKATQLKSVKLWRTSITDDAEKAFLKDRPDVKN